MVANKLNPDVTFFLAMMNTPLIGNRNVINGHALYNAMLCWSSISPKDIDKVSFGITQNEAVSFKGSNVYKIRIPKEIPIKESVLTNLKHGYEAFVVLRSIQNTFTNPLLDYSPIPFSMVHTQQGQRLIAHEIDYFTFYVVWKDAKPNIRFLGTELAIGMGRNNGFGMAVIEDVYNTNMDELVASVPEKDRYTAVNGIKGICNHSRYGFGEYTLDTTNTGQRIIKLTSPLCLNSTFANATHYGTLPGFVKPVPYTKIPYCLWDKGIEQTLQVITPGKAFEITTGG